MTQIRTSTKYISEITEDLFVQLKKKSNFGTSIP